MNERPAIPKPAAANAPGWEQEIEELRLRRAQALALGGPEAVAKHHDRGRLTIRERIDRLVDGSSFQEVGSLTGKENTTARP